MALETKQMRTGNSLPTWLGPSASDSMSLCPGLLRWEMAGAVSAGLLKEANGMVSARFWGRCCGGVG